jgi:hypothetical protein
MFHFFNLFNKPKQTIENSDNTIQALSDGNVCKITVNGVTKTVLGSISSVIGKRIYVDGKAVSMEGLNDDAYSNSEVVNIIIEGSAQDITCTGNVTVHGNVVGKIASDEDVCICGDMSGTIIAEGDVSIEGAYEGPVRSNTLTVQKMSTSC